MKQLVDVKKIDIVQLGKDRWDVDMLAAEFLIIYQTLKMSITAKYKHIFNALDSDRTKYITWQQWKFAFDIIEPHK